jgi:hypothetical protein
LKLLVTELKTSLFQTVTPDKNTQVEAVRINIYKHNIPSGTLSLEIHDNAGELIATSATTILASEISSSNFFHGFVRFYVNAQLRKDVAYRIVLKASGYTFSEAAYFGWCNSFDLQVYAPDYTPANGFLAPLSLEIWERT